MWVRTSASPVLEGGRVTKVTGTLMDISELKFAQASLVRNEEQLRLAMEASSDGIWDWNCQENISNFNLAYAQMLGYEPHEIPRSMQEWLELIHPDDLAIIRKTNQDWLDGKMQTHEIEMRMKTKSGGYKWVLSRGKVVKWDAAGKPLRIIGTHVDITERKHVEEALKRANHRLENQVAANEAMQALLLEQATHDALTGLYNRRFMDDALQRELARANREEQSVCVLMLDVDHFKNFNDTYGHEAGDQVLVMLGNLLLTNVRESDFACRYGGEEFVVILPGVSVEDGWHRAEHLRLEFVSRGSQSEALRATVSIGLAAFPQHGLNGDELLRAADNAMYAAKNAGRNCVRVAIS